MSPLVCVIILFIISNILLIIDYVKRYYDNNKRYKRGFFDSPCPESESEKYLEEIRNDWNQDRKLFSNKYIEYLEYNNNALEDYKTCLLWEKQIQNGYSPDYIPEGYDKNYYIPTTHFIEKYKYDIKKFYKKRENTVY